MSEFAQDLSAGTPLKAAVHNQGHGGSSGKTFTLTHDNHAVTKLQVWTNTGSGGWSDRYLVKDIELTWDDGTVRHITNNQTGDSSDFDFNNKETISKLTLRTGDRVDKVSFETSEERSYSQGEDNGSARTQKVGNGVLLGFHGTYDAEKKELISLGSDFKN